MSGAGNSHPGRQSAEDRKQAVLPHPSSSGAVPRAQVGRAALLGTGLAAIVGEVRIGVARRARASGGASN